jgi:hypothetical protein
MNIAYSVGCDVADYIISHIGRVIKHFSYISSPPLRGS